MAVIEVTLLLLYLAMSSKSLRYLRLAVLLVIVLMLCLAVLLKLLCYCFAWLGRVEYVIVIIISLLLSYVKWTPVGKDRIIPQYNTRLTPQAPVQTPIHPLNLNKITKHQQITYLILQV